MNAAEKLPYISEVQKEHKPLRALKNKGEKFPLRGKIKLYKFMDWDAFNGTLSKGLQFCEPSCWPDKFESRFYEANYSSIPVEIYDPNEDEEIKKNGHITIIP